MSSAGWAEDFSAIPVIRAEQEARAKAAEQARLEAERFEVIPEGKFTPDEGWAEDHSYRGVLQAEQEAEEALDARRMANALTVIRMAKAAEEAAKKARSIAEVDAVQARWKASREKAMRIKEGIVEKARALKEAEEKSRQEEEYWEALKEVRKIRDEQAASGMARDLPSGWGLL